MSQIKRQAIPNLGGTASKALSSFCFEPSVLSKYVLIGAAQRPARKIRVSKITYIGG